MSKIVKGFVAMVALGLVVPSAAIAKGEDRPHFPRCDGSPSPIPPKANGEAPAHFEWGRPQWPYRVPRVAYGEAGATACDTALADALLDPRYADRKVAILRAKVLHQIAAKQDAAALLTIDQVDSAARREANYDQTVGLGTQALRAIAFYRLNRSAEANAALARISSARPYSASIQSLAHSVQMVFDPDRISRDKVLRAQAVLSPAHLNLMFWRSLSFGQFDDALAYSRQISFDIPRSRSGWTITGDETRKYDLIGDRASLAGAGGYALAALGRAEESTRAMAAARAEIEDSVQPPIPPESPDFKYMGGSKRKDWEKRKEAGAKASAALEDWTKAIAFRATAPRHTIKELGDMPGKPGAEAGIVITDILRQAKVGEAGDKAMAEQLITALERRNEQAVGKAMGMTFAELAESLPTVELASNKPRMRGELGPLLNDRMDAYSISKAEDPALFNVRFGGRLTSRAALEEAAILKAADRAAELGKDGIIIEARRTLKRTVMYGTNPVPEGNEVRLLVRPVMIAALPPERRDAGWRVLKVADIRAALASKYQPER